MTPAQIAIHTDGAVSCGTRLWRFRGRLELTVVVKAVFAIVPDGVATPVGPGEIVVADRHYDLHPLRSVEAASDLAPYLRRCDVLFVGHAHAAGAPAAAGAVRLGVSREGQRLLDKTLHVYGDRGPSGAPQPFARMPIVYERAVGRMSAPNPIGTETPNLADPADPQRAACFGPISCQWPVRRRLLGPLDGKLLEAPIAELPETIAWEYFQAAPPDQQLDPLRGGEWLVLDGLHPTRPRVQTRLPSARGAARIVARRSDQAGIPPTAVELVCDTLAIDGDRQTFSLSWRGQYPVLEGEAALPSLSVLAALEAPGVPADWARILGTTAREAPAAQPRPSRHDQNRTMALPAMDQAMLASLPVVPFPTQPTPGPPAQHAPEIVGAPWSHLPAPPVAREEEHMTADDIEPEPASPVVTALHSEPPPPMIAPPPPPPDPWARPPAPPAEPEPQPRAQPPAAFERPAANALKGSFYAKFKK